MQDTTVTFGSLVYTGRQINANYVTTTSQLIGDPVDSITVMLQKVGAPTGTAQIGVFNTDLTVKKLFGTVDVSTISTAYQEYEFKLAGTELYAIGAGDRIGIKFTGGTSSNGINIMIDRNTADPFDGTNSYRTRYESSWLVDTGEDLYMILKQTHGGGAPATAVLTVNAQNGGTALNVPATIGSTTQTTPTTFTLNAGQSYTLSVPTTANAGALTFSSWSDGATTASRTVSITAATTLTANYSPTSSQFPIIHMQDTTITFGSSIYSGRQINAEYFAPASQLVGDRIDSITLRLQKSGAPTGTAQVGVFNTDLSVKKLFAAVDVSTISITYQDYEFRLPGTDLYTIQSGDRIGIKYAGGSGSNNILVMIDRNTADPFDGINSYRTRYESSWLVDTGEDLYMILKQTQAGSGNPPPTATSRSASTNENTAVTIALSGYDPEGQPVEFFILSPPSHGMLGLINQVTRTVTYTPYDYFDGADSFTFVTNDGVFDSTPATVDMSVINTVTKTTSKAVIITVDASGHSVTGFWTTLSQNGATINSGYTHIDFSVNNGQQYGITVSSFSRVFDHWQDTGSTNSARTISITQDKAFIAVYRTN